jgi:hypothetical protein
MKKTRKTTVICPESDYFGQQCWDKAGTLIVFAIVFAGCLPLIPCGVSGTAEEKVP